MSNVTLVAVGMHNAFANTSITVGSAIKTGKLLQPIMDKMNAWMQTGSAYAGQYIYCDVPDVECGELAFTQDDFWTAYLPAGAYYAQPVLWAYHAGVVNGCGADTFCPTQAISRQDLTVILYRYACLAGIADAAQSENVLSGFADAGAVSDYARAALAWAVENGIVYGRDDHRIDPRGTATRAECAALLWRFASQYSLA